MERNGAEGVERSEALKRNAGRMSEAASRTERLP